MDSEGIGFRLQEGISRGGAGDTENGRTWGWGDGETGRLGEVERLQDGRWGGMKHKWLRVSAVPLCSTTE